MTWQDDAAHILGHDGPLVLSVIHRGERERQVGRLALEPDQVRRMIPLLEPLERGEVSSVLASAPRSWAQCDAEQREAVLATARAWLTEQQLHTLKRGHLYRVRVRSTRGDNLHNGQIEGMHDSDDGREDDGPTFERGDDPTGSLIAAWDQLALRGRRVVDDALIGARDVREEIAATREDYREQLAAAARELAATREDYREQLAAAARELAATREDYREQFAARRDAYREEVAALRAEHREQVNGLRDHHREQLDQMQQRHERQLSTMEDSFKVQRQGWEQAITDARDEAGRLRNRITTLEEYIREVMDDITDKAIEARKVAAEGERTEVISREVGESFRELLGYGARLGALYVCRDNLSPELLPTVEALLGGGRGAGASLPAGLFEVLGDPQVRQALDSPEVQAALKDPARRQQLIGLLQTLAPAQIEEASA